MDAAYNTYNNAMGVGLTAAASLNNTVQSMTNQSANNVNALADAIGINMVERDVERSFGGGPRSNITKKAKFTPSSKYKIELKYSSYIKDKHQNEMRRMADEMNSIENNQTPISNESVYQNGPSITCQRLNDRIESKTGQLESKVTIHANVIGMNRHIFANSCKPIKVNGKSIANFVVNSNSLEKYYGKPVVSVQNDIRDDLDVSSVNKENITKSVDDVFRTAPVSIDDTFQVTPINLDSSIEKQTDTIIDSPNSVLPDDSMQRPVGISDKGLEATNEYNVDSLFKNESNNSNFQLPSVDSFKTDSIDVVADTAYVPNTRKKETFARKERINDYIGSSDSQVSLLKLRDALTKEAEKNASLQQVVGNYESEIFDAKKEREILENQKREAERKAKQRYESFVQTNETLDRTRQEMEETLQKTQTDISNIMKDLKELNAMLEVEVPTRTPVGRGRRGRAA